MSGRAVKVRQGGGRSKLIACLAAVAFTLTLAPSLAFAEDGVVADDSTIGTWQGYTTTNSTENVGRIWTDKTVQTDDITL